MTTQGRPKQRWSDVALEESSDESDSGIVSGQRWFDLAWEESSDESDSGIVSGQRWSDLALEESSDESDSGIVSSVSTQTPSKKVSFSEKELVVNIGGSFASSDDEPIKLATVSAAPLADSIIEDHAPCDLHAGDDTPGSSVSGTMEFLNAGSASHRVGTCIPCKFTLTKRGCNIGLGCNFCHYPHEGVTRNTLRKQLQNYKKHLKPIAGIAAAAHFR